jgi:hypothetical protein
MFKEGDLIVTAKGAGEVVGVVDTTLEVYFIVPTDNKKIFAYAEEWEVINQTDVTLHVKRPKNKFDYPKCYRQIGFKAYTEDIFVPVEYVDDADVLNELPTDCIETDDEEYEDMSDFILDDKDGEPFCPASPTNQFVVETHQAVNAWEEWAPSNLKEQGVKNFIDNMQVKYSTMDDDRHFERGETVDYNHPPESR